jgi:hypothetical protein
MVSVVFPSMATNVGFPTLVAMPMAETLANSLAAGTGGTEIE